MQEIDLASWNRREHFAFFRRADLPFYNVNTTVDISGVRDYAKAHALSFNTLLVYLTTRALNRIENFHYRLHGETVVALDTIHPAFVHLRQGEELFCFITVDFQEDLAGFARAVRAEIAQSTNSYNLVRRTNRDDLVFISSLPWISFTGIDHSMSLNKDDGIPRITWGKYFDANGKTLLPFNIQVNHIFVDGLHVGRFFEALAQEIETIRTRI